MKLQTIMMLTTAALWPWLVGAQEPEPGVQTSSAAAPAQPAASPSPVTPAARSTAARPKPVAPPAATPVEKDKAAVAERKPSGKSSDRIQLDTTEISGNQELPKVMYVVPWRKADPGEFAGRPPNSLLDEALTPVDRDVFKRQNRYYGALKSDPASKDEK